MAASERAPISAPPCIQKEYRAPQRSPFACLKRTSPQQPPADQSKLRRWQSGYPLASASGCIAATAAAIHALSILVRLDTSRLIFSSLPYVRILSCRPGRFGTRTWSLSIPAEPARHKCCHSGQAACCSPAIRLDQWAAIAGCVVEDAANEGLSLELEASGPVAIRVRTPECSPGRTLTVRGSNHCDANGRTRSPKL